MIPEQTLRRATLAVALGLALTLLPDAASAQTADGLVQWFVMTYGRGIINAAIIGVAILFLIMRAGLGIVLAVAGGGLLFANRDYIAGMFGV